MSDIRFDSYMEYLLKYVWFDLGRDLAIFFKEQYLLPLCTHRYNIRLLNLDFGRFMENTRKKFEYSKDRLQQCTTSHNTHLYPGKDDIYEPHLFVRLNLTTNIILTKIDFLFHYKYYILNVELYVDEEDWFNDFDGTRGFNDITIHHYLSNFFSYCHSKIQNFNVVEQCITTSSSDRRRYINKLIKLEECLISDSLTNDVDDIGVEILYT